tara:strand:- start:1525 stop:1722 length:198 start_codon:yes stop_codon:yes gene_type:complete
MDNYVYISVKLNLKDGQTEDSIQEIVQDMDYSFEHAEIIDHEIIDVLDTQTSEESEAYGVLDEDA